MLYRAVSNPNKNLHQEQRLITLDAKTLSVVITGLKSFTIYSVRVMAYTIKGNGTPSTVIHAGMERFGLIGLVVVLIV